MGTNLIRLKDQAIALRLRGKSYGYIKKKLSISSKGTLSYWFKNLILPPETIVLLKKNINIAWEKGLIDFNTKRNLRIRGENESEYAKGVASIPLLKKRDLFLIGVALYWGEGTKDPGSKSPFRLAFTNSDPSMIAVYMRFLKEVLEIDTASIRAGIHIYSSIRPEQAKEYWSGVTGLPTSRFYIVIQVSRASQGKKKYNTLPFGTAVIKVNRRLAFLQVKGMIDGLKQQLLGKILQK